jgi:toxin ParE1/3/4
MPETRRLIWAPAAEYDLIGIWHYYARVGSPGVADRLLGDIRQVANRMAQQPFLLGRARDDLRPGLRSVQSQPYLIFYRVDEKTVEVSRVLHGRRNLKAILAADE